MLDIARQTVLHKVQHGELEAVHLTNGRRKGLRIQVEHDQPGLFDTPHGKKGAVLTMTDLAGDHPEGLLGDGPGDPGGGLGVGGVPVQRRRCQVTAERIVANPKCCCMRSIIRCPSGRAGRGGR